MKDEGWVCLRLHVPMNTDIGHTSFHFFTWRDGHIVLPIYDITSEQFAGTRAGGDYAIEHCNKTSSAFYFVNFCVTWYILTSVAQMTRHIGLRFDVKSDQYKSPTTSIGPLWLRS